MRWGFYEDLKYDERDTVTGKDYLPDAPADADASPLGAPTLDGITKTTIKWINFWVLDIILLDWIIWITGRNSIIECGLDF